MRSKYSLSATFYQTEGSL